MSFYTLKLSKFKKVLAVITTGLFFVVPLSPVFAAPSTSSLYPSISTNASYISFVSGATDLVVGDTNGVMDIFLRDISGRQTTRISVDSSGVESNAASGTGQAISLDGRYVVFVSSASNLVVGDTNGTTDVFLHDTQTGETTRVSVDSTGTQSNAPSYYPSSSSDGRYIAFMSNASNLVVGDADDSNDIFLHDTQTGDTTLVSVDPTGLIPGNASSSTSSISSDGRYVVFQSTASNLVPSDTNGFTDIFLRDTQDDSTIRVSVDSSGTQGNNSSDSPAISSDGRYVVFVSSASNLVAGDTNGTTDVFLHDTQTGETTRVSVDSTGTQSNAASYYPSSSSDGRYIAFMSNASNLVVGDTNDSNDIFLHDTQTGDTTRVSVDSTGIQGDSVSNYPAISSDGRYVVFQSTASNLVTEDTDGVDDIFLHDTQTGETTLVSRVSNPGIAYTSSFTENAANDGSLDNSIIATLTLDTFINAGSTLTLDTHYTLTNAPAGLTPVMTINGDGTTATLTFTGTATDHENINDVANLTITFLDGAFTDTATATDVTNYTYTTGVIDFDDAEPEPEPETSSSSSSGSSSRSRAIAQKIFADYYAAQSDTTDATLETPSLCQTEQIITQNLKAPSRNGVYNSYTGGIVIEINILQAHLNRLGFNSGPVDGIAGPLTSGAIKRMQTFLGTAPDGYVGPITRGLLNTSCSSQGLQTN